MTEHAERLIVNGVIAALGILAVGIKAADAANAWVRRKERLSL